VRYALEDGREQTVTIVGMDEADSLAGQVSWISPVARALLKAHVGDEVPLHTPQGLQHLEVLEVTYPARA
jgi:transcription elongation factor GreB